MHRRYGGPATDETRVLLEVRCGGWKSSDSPYGSHHRKTANICRFLRQDGRWRLLAADAEANVEQILNSTGEVLPDARRLPESSNADHIIWPASDRRLRYDLACPLPQCGIKVVAREERLLPIFDRWIEYFLPASNLSSLRASFIELPVLAAKLNSS